MRLKTVQPGARDNAAGARARPAAASASEQQGAASALRTLQRKHGNRFVQQLLRTNAIQTKLTVNQPGDSYEQEADRVSEEVMRMPEPQLQRYCACGGECPKCQTDQPGLEQERLQTKRVRVSDTGQIAAPPIVHEVLRSPGQPLDPATRAFMEQRFGYDLSQVLVHTGAQAAGSARAVDARAYTVGQHIVFDAGQYAQTTSEGKRLLAHELTHTIQQHERLPAVQRVCKGSAQTRNAIVSNKKDDYEQAVKAGKYCRDTGFTGALHSGTCYREIPTRSGYFNCPSADQVCFDDKGGCKESPDKVSPVEKQESDGSCNLHGFCSSLHGVREVEPVQGAIIGALTPVGVIPGAIIGWLLGRE